MLGLSLGMSMGRTFANPSAITSDTFNRADSTDLGQTDAGLGGASGFAWTEHVGTWEIKSNTLQRTDGGALQATCTIDAEVTDCYVTCDITCGTMADRDAGIVVRHDGTGYYLFTISGSTLILYYTPDNSTFNLLGSVTHANILAATSLRVIANGETLVGLCGDQVLEYTEATENASATRVGVRRYPPATDTAFDNFVVWPVSEAEEYTSP